MCEICRVEYMRCWACVSIRIGPSRDSKLDLATTTNYYYYKLSK